VTRQASAGSSRAGWLETADDGVGGLGVPAIPLNHGDHGQMVVTEDPLKIH
jgi:hypothetical protein